MYNIEIYREFLRLLALAVLFSLTFAGNTVCTSWYRSSLSNDSYYYYQKGFFERHQNYYSLVNHCANYGSGGRPGVIRDKETWGWIGPTYYYTFVGLRRNSDNVWRWIDDSLMNTSLTPWCQTPTDTAARLGLRRRCLTALSPSSVSTTGLCELPVESCSSSTCPVGSFRNELTNKCQMCPIGKYSGSAGVTSCNSCSDGSSTIRIGATKNTECTPCLSGYYSAEEASSLVGDPLRCKACPPGFYQDVAGQSSCKSCLSGYFQSGSGQISCEICPLGTYNDVEGQTFCRNCPIGRFSSNLGADECSFCPNGWTTNVVGASNSSDCRACFPGSFSLRGNNSLVEIPLECEPCPVGTSQEAEGQSSCSSCPSGSFQRTEGQITCELCPIGTYQDQQRQPFCSLCPFGRSSSVTGSIECSFCPYGLTTNFSGATNSEFCIPCLAGKFSSMENRLSLAGSPLLCESCVQGKYGPINGLNSSEKCLTCRSGTYSLVSSSTCTDCPLGKFSAQEESFQCEFCPAGKFQNSSSQSFCMDCIAGTKSSEVEGSTSCDLCVPGSYSQNRQASCTPCNPGFYSEFFGSSNVESCLACPGGKYNGFNGRSSCEDCPAGKYTLDDPKASHTECLPCEVGKFSSEFRSSSCEPCPSGKYMDVTGGTSCKLCLPGTYGDGEGGVDTTVCAPCAIGRFNPDAGAPNGEGCKICPALDGIDCPVGSSFPSLKTGFWRKAPDYENIFQCVPPEACLPAQNDENTSCLEGYTGQACSICVPFKFYRLGEKCLRCSNKAYKWVLFGFMAVGLIWGMYKFLSKKSLYPYADLRIATNWFQFMSLFNQLSNDWPFSLSRLFSISKLINFDVQFFGVECETEISFWTMWKLKLAMPLLLMISFGLASIIYPLYLHIKSLLGFSVIFPENFREKLIFALTLSFSLLYTLLVTTSISPVNCFLQPTGVYVLLQEPSVQCYDEVWMQNLPFLVTAFVVYVLGFPLCIAAVFFIYRKKIPPNQFESMFGHFSMPYKESFFWWELVNILHKSATVVTGLFLASSISPSSRIFSVILVLFGKMYVENLLKPYDKDWDNQIAFSWGLIDSLTLSTIFIFQDSLVSAKQKSFIAICLIIIVSIALCISLFHIGQIISAKIQRRAVSLVDSYKKRTEAHRLEQAVHVSLISFPEYYIGSRNSLPTSGLPRQLPSTKNPAIERIHGILDLQAPVHKKVK